MTTTAEAREMLESFNCPDHLSLDRTTGEIVDWDQEESCTLALCTPAQVRRFLVASVRIAEQAREQDHWERYCLNRVAPLGED